MVEGKIRNQEKLLRYFAKYLKKADPARFEKVDGVASRLRAQWKRVREMDGESIDQRRETLMGIEGVGVRYRVSEACLDFGLERIQFSVFRGKLNRNKREELLMRLTNILGEEMGKILIQPMCEEDFQAALELTRL